MSDTRTFIVTTREVVIRAREVEAASKSEAARIVRRGIADAPIIDEVKLERVSVIRADDITD